MGDKAIPVRVALRIRPLVPKEIAEGSQAFVTKVSGQPQVFINGSSEAFTYDYVFGPEEAQGQVYDLAVTKIINKIFKGYNVTILAYGQTGSGKTFTMGTAETSALVNQKSGIIQRAVQDLFFRMAEESSFKFEINVSFLELYMEKVFDLLSKNRHEEVDIREDPKSGIRIHGLTETAVATCEDTLRCLEQGSHNRRTGATAMNQHSSRSHAVFTLTINQINKETLSVVKSSKFHLVDLAGSERASKTLAQGDRFHEGVNINKGLLALGNVISALCETNPRHIPYRDSKLTRLLQDSLGGNSHTLMIACISPADSNYEETLSTLRYADRARKIKNKPIVNQDPTTVELVALRALVAQLQAGNGGGASSAELEKVKQQLKSSEEQKMEMFFALQSALEENTNLTEKALLAEAANQQMKQRLEELQAQAEQTLGAVNQTFNETRELDGQKTIEQLVSLKTKIEEIQDVQRKNEIDQNNHDMQVNEEDEDKENVPSHEDDEGSSPNRRLSVIGADVALRRAKLGDDLKALNAQLAEKVNMVNKMSQDGVPYSLVKAQYDAAVSELEKQVAGLQQEKEELAALLAQASSNVNACKISEQRRKRLQELEPQISELRKKIQEQANVIKLKQKAEEQLKKYNNDIQQMRAQKVKLVRQMREENEKFRQWRVQKEREVARLKDQDRKRQGQLQKMEVLHAKQQNVLRRKMEDAVAVSKRLKEALSLHSSKQINKAATANSAESDQRIKGWLMGELDLLTKIKQAEIALEELIESRRTFAARHSKLEGKMAEATDEGTINSLKNELAIVSADMALRSEQIVELKQKIASADMDSKAKTRLDYLQTMVEAKVALKILLEECVAARGETFHFSSEVQDLRHELEDLQRQHDESLTDVSRHQKEMEELKKKHQTELRKVCRDFDERMLTLMRQLPPCGLKESSDHKVSEQELLQRLKIQQEELERCCTLQEQLNAALNEIEQLKSKARTPTSPEMRPPPIAAVPKAKKPKTAATKVFDAQAITNFTSDEEDDLEYNSDDDPEWRNTPMGKRFKKLKDETFVPPKMADLDGGDNNNGKKGGAKRMSRSHCLCRTGGCRSCICSKDNRSCTKDCSCSASGVCKNTGDNSVLAQEDQNRLLNETFDLGARKRNQASSKENSNIEEEEEEVDDLEMPQKKSRLTKVIKKGGFFDN